MVVASAGDLKKFPPKLPSSQRAGSKLFFTLMPILKARGRKWPEATQCLISKKVDSKFGDLSDLKSYEKQCKIKKNAFWCLSIVWNHTSIVTKWATKKQSPAIPEFFRIFTTCMTIGGYLMSFDTKYARRSFPRPPRGISAYVLNVDKMGDDRFSSLQVGSELHESGSFW